MQLIVIWGYSFVVGLYGLVIALAAIFNTKAKLWIQGRKNWPERLQQAVKPLQEAGKPIVWVHCASLGEFEQGRPLIEALRAQYPQPAIVLTFYSPSGYQIRQNYAHADVVCYMPLDTCRNALIFIKILQPSLVVFVKYEFWYHHLQALFQAQIPVILVAALFRPGQLFFKWYGEPFRQLLMGYSRIFAQNEASAALLRKAGVNQVEVAGDTRVDRVIQMAAQPANYEAVEVFAGSSPVWVCGSTWPQDEALLLPFINTQLPPDWKVIIAPHEISENHIAALEKAVAIGAVRYSRYAQTPAATAARVLIIDNVGMLAHLYQYGRLAYIGGGFGHGIHNTLEPAAFGLPVILGPRYEKFEEAVYLVAHGGFFAVSSADELHRSFQHLLKEEARQQASVEIRSYLQKMQGATARIMSYLANSGWLTQR